MLGCPRPQSGRRAPRDGEEAGQGMVGRKCRLVAVARHNHISNDWLRLGYALGCCRRGAAARAASSAAAAKSAARRTRRRTGRANVRARADQLPAHVLLSAQAGWDATHT